MQPQSPIHRPPPFADQQRTTRETEPLKPFTKLSTLGDTLTDVAEHRKASPDLLRKLVRGDLDWIAMKSLEKDRARRYETANGLTLESQIRTKTLDTGEFCV